MENPQLTNRRTSRRRWFGALFVSVFLGACSGIPISPAQAAETPPGPLRGSIEAGTSADTSIAVSSSPSSRLTSARESLRMSTVRRLRKPSRRTSRTEPGGVERSTSTRKVRLVQGSSNVGHASIAFLPERHGFSFANWSATTTNDDADLSTLRRIFGDISVCAAITDGICTAYDRVFSFLERLNTELDKGRCEGMSLLALQNFREGLTNTADSTKDELIQELNYWSATQVLPAARERTRESRGWSLSRIVSEIHEELTRGGESVLGLHQDKLGHTVLPISIDFTEDSARLRLYDPNYPLVTQTLLIDLVRQSWTYTPVDLSGRATEHWVGHSSGGLSLVPISVRRSAQVDYFRS